MALEPTNTGITASGTVVFNRGVCIFDHASFPMSGSMTVNATGDVTLIFTTITTASNYPAITATPAPTQICGCPNATTGIQGVSCAGNCADGSTKCK